MNGRAPVPLGSTPSQTVGPFLAIGLPWPDGADVVPPGTAGAFVLRGTVYDGAGAIVPDALVETWQADPSGGFVHPEGGAVSAVPGFRGFGRCPTGRDGSYAIRTLRPGVVPAPDGRPQAPHLDVTVLARGLLHRVVTRAYLPDDAAALAADPVLALVPAERRATLVAVPEDGGLRFDVRLQGDAETVFFDV